MAIDVRIPTILRQYTGGAKQVEAKGDSLGALIDDLDAAHPGIKGRLVTGALDTTLSDGDEVTILPAVAGG
jgi:molybdopterin converting factor small subunit